MVRRTAAVGHLLAALALVGCEERPPEPAFLEVFQVPGRAIVIGQRDVERVVAIDALTGQTRWVYEPERPEQPSYAQRPVSTLVCPVAWLPVGRVVLRFHHELHTLDVESGELVWSRGWDGRSFCPVGTLDSGVLTIAGWGTVLEKLDANGEPLWSFGFPKHGPAVTMPIVVRPTGDAIVRTRAHLLNVAPDGELNWSVPYATLPEASR